jgi:hypothetical protein
MEPVFMVLGQSAATAAVFAIDQNSSVQNVNYSLLKQRLLLDKQVLEWTVPKKVLGTRFVEPAKMSGIVIDDPAAKRIGRWIFGSAIGDQIVGTSYSHDGDSGKGNSSLVFTAKIPENGDFQILLHAPVAGNRSVKAPVTISRNGNELEQIFVNQKTGSGKISLGCFQFSKGDSVSVTVSNADTQGHVVADAVQFLPRK